VATYVLRVWVPDRPGALGAVASRIGAVRGDLVGIEILERGAGRAIDELVIDLPDEALVPLLLSEVGQVDGVDVEDVRPAPPALADPRLDALETAALLVEQVDVDALLLTLATHARSDFEADWAAVIDPQSATPLAAIGTPPATEWLGAFVAGSQESVRVAAGECGPDDVAWALVDTAQVAVVVGRRGRPVRARERRQLAALARVASVRWAELAKAMAR
jgi:ACT domain-containing protein